MRIPPSLREDARQAGVLGLMRARDLYDPDQGSFASFARWHVLDQIQKALYRERRGPSGTSKLDCMSDAYALIHGTADADGIWGRRIPDDAPLPDDAADTKRRFELVSAELRKLPAAWRHVIVAQYMHEQSRAEVATETGRSRERVRQLENKALSAVRNALKETMQ
jgi:RNA polymerase sigma factor (sigma-70 family)